MKADQIEPGFHQAGIDDQCIDVAMIHDPTLSLAGMAQLHTPGIQIGENVAYAMGWTKFPFPRAAPVGGAWAHAPLALAFFPEADLLNLALLVFTLGWGTLRTVLAAGKLWEHRKLCLYVNFQDGYGWIVSG